MIISIYMHRLSNSYVVPFKFRAYVFLFYVGRKQGRKEGRKHGWKDGRKDGKKERRKEGRKERRKEGRKEEEVFENILKKGRI